MFRKKHILPNLKVPIEITQKGIVDALNLHISDVSRYLREFVDEGLVRFERAHVEGIAKKVYSYYLTDKGIEYGRKVDDISAFYDIKAMFLGLALIAVGGFIMDRIVMDPAERRTVERWGIVVRR